MTVHLQYRLISYDNRPSYPFYKVGMEIRGESSNLSSNSQKAMMCHFCIQIGVVIVVCTTITNHLLLIQ